MSKDNIFVDTKQLNKIVIGLKGFEKEMPGAVASALNRTVDHINTKLGRIVTQKYAIKTSDVKSTIKKNKAAKGDMSASLVSKGYTLSFAHFPHSPETPIIAMVLGVRHEKARVKVKIIESKGKIISKSGFIAKTGAKSADKIPYNVFHRLGKSRFPIAPIRTLSVPQMIGNEEVEKQIQNIANEKLNERIEHEINWRLDKIKNQVKG